MEIIFASEVESHLVLQHVSGHIPNTGNYGFCQKSNINVIFCQHKAVIASRRNNDGIIFLMGRLRNYCLSVCGSGL